MAISQPACLLDHLREVPDPRSAHGRRHSLRAMLAAVTCAFLCGARLQADRAVGPRSGDRADPRPRFHPQAAQVGGVSHAPLGSPLDGVRGRVVPRGRGLLRGAARRIEGAGGLEPVALDGKTARGKDVLTQGGPDFVAVKENQPDLLRNIQDAFTPPSDAAFPPLAAGPHRAAVLGTRHRREATGSGRDPKAADDHAAQRLS